jgi:hypothetical protein
VLWRKEKVKQDIGRNLELLRKLKEARVATMQSGGECGHEAREVIEKML